MTHNDLHRAVAKATGEAIEEINRRGFQPLAIETDQFDPEDLIIDWDELDRRRNTPLVEQRQPRAVA